MFFGIGMGLALDEFALWLDLKDVYWSQQGRKSIDAVIIAATISGMILVGFTAWVDVATEVEDVVSPSSGAFGLIASSSATVVNLAKEKFGICRRRVPHPADSGSSAAFRLGHPESLWARIFYSDEKKARADARFMATAVAHGSPPKQEPASGQSGAGSG